MTEALVYMHEVESWGGGVVRYFMALEMAGLPLVAEERDGFFKVVLGRTAKSAEGLWKII